MKLCGSYKVKVGSRIFGGENTLLWAGVLSGLGRLDNKVWSVRFLREIEGKPITRNPYLEHSDLEVIGGNLGLLSKEIQSYSMRVVFEGYPGELDDVDGLLICNEDNVAISVYKFRERANLEDNVKVTVLWRVEIRGV